MGGVGRGVGEGEDQPVGLLPVYRECSNARYVIVSTRLSPRSAEIGCFGKF